MTPLSSMHESWQLDHLLALRSSAMTLRDWQGERLREFSRVGFPHRKVESWKYTPVTAIAKQPFYRAAVPSALSIDLNAWKMINAHVIVFVNGQWVPEWSDELPPGVSLTTADATSDVLQTANTRSCRPPLCTPFALLNDGLFSTRLLLRVAPSVSVLRPIQCLFVTDNNALPTMSHPRLAIHLEQQAAMTWIETYAGKSAMPYFNNVVTEITLASHAALSFYKLQTEDNNAFHIANTLVQQDAHSQLWMHHFSMGSALAREDISVQLQAAGARAMLAGLYQTRCDQHMDYHTAIDHLASHTTSRQHYRALADHTSRAIFNGKIYVDQAAVKTEATQLNKNLLLSKTAVVNAKPELEIYASDVRCTHGATVGQLDAAALFYLQSRGIEQSLATQLLMTAFAEAIFSECAHAEIAQQIRRVIVGE